MELLIVSVRPNGTTCGRTKETMFNKKSANKSANFGEKQLSLVSQYQFHRTKQ